MVLEFDYGVNTGNRFLQFVDHDEEPEAFIAAQTKEEIKQKKPATKDTKQPTKKSTTTTSTITTTAKTNKENLTTKPTNVEQQRRQQSATVPAVFSDNNNQQIRGDSARGTRGGGLRRGGPPFEGTSGRGRSQRFNKFEGPGSSSTNETPSLDQGGDTWTNESGPRGGGRGRGGPRRGSFEGGRGNFEGGRGNYEGGRGGTGGRGRGRGGRGNFNNRNQEEGSQQEPSGWQQTAESNFESARPQTNRDFDQEVSPSERPFEPDNTRRNPRGNYRGRTFRNYGDRESTEGAQDDYRANRRQTDRQPRSFVSGVKPIEKKDGEGAHNWGNPTENPEEHPITDETAETTGPTPKDWAQQVDEAEKQMTLDEYKKQVEAKKRAYQEKLPQFNTRAAGEGEDPKNWHKFEQEYRKKHGDDDEEEDEDEEGSGVEENESGEELEEEHISGKKKIITIPLRFKPIELSRGSAGSRGGQRRGGNRFRSNRDEQQRPTSPTQGQSSPSSQQFDEQQSSYRGSGRRGGDYRRPPRGGSRQGGRTNADPNAPALDNPDDFPTLPKHSKQTHILEQFVFSFDA
ncbi:unnamed protein product [Rotaria sordida]|uniref:Hyaluronan/mRNA-binding protein domain-containing protein n=1 Tax=Rotaria sordida TaxID=392033 RepID=A0A814HX75_9BILA|nr:unnamed protein product [Rotaria sordida]